MFLFLALAVIMGSAFGQKMAIGGLTGMTALIRNTNITLPINVSFEYAFKEDMSVETDLGYEIGFKNEVSMFHFNPEYRYHFDKAFDGLYVGGYVSAGAMKFNGNYVGVGASGGYQKMLCENFNIDANLQLGYGSNGFKGGGDRVHGLHLRPTFAARFTF